MIHHLTYPLFYLDLYLGVKVTQNVAKYPPHRVTFAPAKLEAVISKKCRRRGEDPLQENTLFDL